MWRWESDEILLEAIQLPWNSTVVFAHNKTAKTLGTTTAEICKAIIAEFTHTTTESCFHLTEPLGCLYNMRSAGNGQWVVAHPYFVYSAISHCGGPNFLCGEKWQQIETLSTLILNCNEVTVKGAHGEINLPKCTQVKFQEEIGDAITPDANEVTVVKLASGHNLIDSIVYDVRYRPMIYFIQTSTIKG